MTDVRVSTVGIEVLIRPVPTIRVSSVVLDVLVSDTVVPTGPTIRWYDGAAPQSATLLGWYDGADVQPATLLGWWDGADIQPVTSS